VSKIDEGIIERMELFVLDEALNYSMFVTEKNFFEYYTKIYKYVEKRVLSSKKNLSKAQTSGA
jgi:hypothetical protein